jgi:hypothetical protein
MPTKRKKTKTNILARILIKKSGDKESRDRQILVQWAKTMQFCRQPYEDPDTHRTHNLKHCKLALCPTCQTRKAKRNRDFLYNTLVLGDCSRPDWISLVETSLARNSTMP